MITQVDKGIIHEITHRLCVIDEYHFLYPNDPGNARGSYELQDDNGNILTLGNGLENHYYHFGFMGGGEGKEQTDGGAGGGKPLRGWSMEATGFRSIVELQVNARQRRRPVVRRIRCGRKRLW